VGRLKAFDNEGRQTTLDVLDVEVPDEHFFDFTQEDIDRGSARNDAMTVASSRGSDDAGRLQGTFDLLHPGHVHYLEDAATYGDELHAIVAARRTTVTKPAPILCAEQRRDMVAALTAVDEAHLGHPEDVFVPIQRLDPDVIVLGFDQHHDEADRRRRARRARYRLPG